MDQTTTSSFAAESLSQNSIHFLLSGSLDDLAQFSGGAWTWPDSGSWVLNPVSSGSLIDTPVSSSSDGTNLRIVGITIGTRPTGYEVSTVFESLRNCKFLCADFIIGDLPKETVKFKVLSRKVKDGHLYFEVDHELPALVSNVAVYFKGNREGEPGGDYSGYTCYYPDNNVTVNLYPFIPPVESEEYNPILNNAVISLTGTIARFVEIFEYSPNVSLERPTVLADIPDSFYTGLAGTLGRFLGSKNAEYSTYIGRKQQFVDKNIETCQEILKSSRDRVVYEGSPLTVSKSLQDYNIKSMEGTIRGTLDAGTRLSGSLEGVLAGTIAGYVSNIDFLPENGGIINMINYYSNSVPAENHILHFPDGIRDRPLTYSVKGEGTYHIQTSGALFSSYGCEAQNMTHVGEYYNNTPGWGQIGTASIVHTWTNSTGNIRTLGTVQVAGRVFSYDSESVISNALTQTSYPSTWNMESREDQRYIIDDRLVYIQNGYISGTIGGSQSGTTSISSNGGVCIEGTVGTGTTAVSINVFNGTCSISSSNEISGSTETGSVTTGSAGQTVGFTCNSSTQDIIISGVNTADNSNLILDSYNGSIAGINGKGTLDVQNCTVDFNRASTVAVFEVEDMTTGIDMPPSGDYIATAAGWDAITGSNYYGIKGALFGSASLPRGTALMIGSQKPGSTVTGTRGSSRGYYTVPGSSGSISTTEMATLSDLLSNLRAGLAFVKTVYDEWSGSIPYSSNEAYTLPDTYRNSIFQARTTILSGSNVPIWDPQSQEGYNIYITQGFVFGYQVTLHIVPVPDPVQAAAISYYKADAEQAISTLETYIAGQTVTIEDTTLENGQRVCVRCYANNLQKNAAELNVEDFIGTCTFSNGIVQSFSASSAVSGSCAFVQGSFSKGTLTFKTNTSATQVIYGSFAYSGSVGDSGQFYSNTIRGTLTTNMEPTNGWYWSGKLVGNLNGTVLTGRIPSCSVGLYGTSRGSFTGQVMNGTIQGPFRDLNIQGNDLHSNLYLEGYLGKGIENIPLEGTIDGEASAIALPTKASYNLIIRPRKQLNPSNEASFVEVNMPEMSTNSGTCSLQYSGTGSVLEHIQLDGESINRTVSQSYGMSSGSVIFGPDGKIITSRLHYTMSGQFEISQEDQWIGIIPNTANGNPFTGRVDSIHISQSISGTFDITTYGTPYVDLNSVTGSAENLNGNLIVQGTVFLNESGGLGNLVEGRDRPFFTVKSFSGSVFSEDLTLDAIENMTLSDMTFETLGFSSGMALVPYTEVHPVSGSTIILKEQEYVRKPADLPRIGDIIYSDPRQGARVVSSKVYCPELNALFTVNDHGIITYREVLG